MMSELTATSFITTTTEAYLCDAIKNNDKVTLEKLLVEGCDLNAVDEEGNTALHLACNTENVPLSILLLAKGAKFDILNQHHNTALHEVCRKRLSDVVVMMVDRKVEFEKTANIINKNGLPPLHISSQLGPADLVRFLVIGGADVEYINKYGKDAEQIAVENKQFEVARLMKELKQSWDYRSRLLNDLKEDNLKIDRVSLKVFGNSGVGKTTLIESLKSGYLKRIFSFSKRKNEINDFFLPELSDDDKAMVRPPLSRYTRGIQVDQCGITDVGKLSIWEFSGFEQYTAHFDMFLHQSTYIFLIVFDIQDDLEMIIEQNRFEEDKKNAAQSPTDSHPENQIPMKSITRSDEDQPEEIIYLESSRDQVAFWLNYIRATLPLNEPIGLNGDCIWKPSVILVGTHVIDDGNRSCLTKSYKEFVQDLQDEFQRDLDIQSDMLLLDARIPGGEPMKKLRNKIGSLKRNLIKNMPCTINCLQKALRETKRLSHEVDYLYWNDYVEAMRNTVNSLALDKHIRTIVNQLQQMGEVIFLEVEGDQDIVVLKPNWLTSNIIGHLLSFEILESFHIDGFISNNELSMLFPNEDLFELKKILKAVDICTEHRLPSDILYMPSLNFDPSPEDIWDGWNVGEDDDDEAYDSPNNDGNNNKKFSNNNEESVKNKSASEKKMDNEREREKWIGVQLGPFDQDDVVGEIIGLLFPRCVIAIRNATRNRDICPCLITEIFSWDTAIRMDCENSSTIVKLSPSQDHIDVITRGHSDSILEIFCFNEFILSVIFGKLEMMTPGIFICRFSMSPNDLRRTYKRKHDHSSTDDDSSGYDIDLYENHDLSEGAEPFTDQKDDDRPKENKKNHKKNEKRYEDDEDGNTLAIRVYDSKEILDCIMASKSTSFEDIMKCELNKNLPSEQDTLQEEKTEKLINVIACGSEVIFKHLVLGCDLHLSVLHIQARMMLADLLDEEVKRSSVVIVEECKSGGEVEVEGGLQQNNWRHLAKVLQVSETFQDEKEAELKGNGDVTLVRASPTDTILALSTYNITSSIGNLCAALRTIRREDARDVVLRSVPSYNLSMSPMLMFQTLDHRKQYNLFENIEFKNSWYSHHNKKASQLVLEEPSNKKQESYA